jgi:predicted SAM-dependent methyltransferase
MKALNIGCGNRFHPDWTNLDFHSTGPGVIAHNLLDGLPFANNTFDVVYHSHVIEHFTKKDAAALIKECYRVLRPGGTLRVVFPDFEQAVREYLTALDDVRAGNKHRQQDYEWMVIEMIDQYARHFSGGEMMRYFVRENLQNTDFIGKRLGADADELIRFGKFLHEQNAKNAGPAQIPILRKGIGKMFSMAKNTANIFLRPAETLQRFREWLLRKLLGKEYRALEVGRFRLSGEVHQWLYDSHGMAELLSLLGFRNIEVMDAQRSRIENWSRYCLDVTKEGKVIRANSCYMEAKK